jgi:undecaprenyl-diphosphatase
VDYKLARAFDAFSAHHDAFEDPLRAYVVVSELVFVLAILALLLLVPGSRGELARRTAVAAAASTALAVVIAHFVSAAVDRPRPFVAHAGTIHAFINHAADPSFPSDHATAAFAIATAVVLRVRLPGTVLLVLAGVLAIGRVFMGLHYPSDVLAGAAVGAAAAVGCWWQPVRIRLDVVADAIGRAIDAGLRWLAPG